MIEILKWVCGIIMIITASNMSTVIRAEKVKSKCWFTPFDVFDYVVISRQQSGKIGIVFWLFLISVLCFFTLLIFPVM
jgi:hypothetical protein